MAQELSTSEEKPLIYGGLYKKRIGFEGIQDPGRYTPSFTKCFIPEPYVAIILYASAYLAGRFYMKTRQKNAPKML